MSLQAIADYESGISSNPLTAILRRLSQSPLFAWFYSRIGPRVDGFLMRRAWGRSIMRAYGLPTMLLHTTGAKSGQPRSSPLLYVRDGNAFVVAGTNFGQDHHPAWTANLLAHPHATVQIGPHEVKVEASPGADWDRLWPRFVAMNPGYATYLQRTSRKPRMFVLQPDS